MIGISFGCHYVPFFIALFFLEPHINQSLEKKNMFWSVVFFGKKYFPLFFLQNAFFSWAASPPNE